MFRLQQNASFPGHRNLQQPRIHKIHESTLVSRRCQLLALNKKTEYSRLVAELYIPAISNALDLHIRVIQNIAGYYGVLNTCPLPNMGSPENKKTITLILIDDTYHPVVNVPGQPPAVYKSIQQVSTEKCPVVLMGETPEKEQTTWQKMKMRY